MSDTPRTDHASEYDDTTVDCVKAFARTLERELNEMTELASEMADRLSSIGKGGGGRHPLAYRFDKIMERIANEHRHY